MTIRSATRGAEHVGRARAVQVGRNRCPAPVASSARRRSPRCGARRHHNAAAVCSTGSGPCRAAAASRLRTGRPGGFGEVEPADEDRPELVGDNSVHVGAVLGQDVRSTGRRRRRGHRRPCRHRATRSRCRWRSAIRRGRSPAGRRSSTVDRLAARHTARSTSRSRSRRYGTAHPGASSRVHAADLRGEFGDQVGDQRAAGGEIRRPHGCSARAAGMSGIHGSGPGRCEWFPVGSSR